jgi:hypothetical protein
LDCDGALHYVKFGKEIARVNVDVINGLKFIIENGNNIEVTTQRFSPGTKLIIKQGVLAGLDCEVVEHKSGNKVIARMSLMNRNVLADLPFSLLIQLETK